MDPENYLATLQKQFESLRRNDIITLKNKNPNQYSWYSTLNTIDFPPIVSKNPRFSLFSFLHKVDRGKKTTKWWAFPRTNRYVWETGKRALQMQNSWYHTKYHDMLFNSGNDSFINAIPGYLDMFRQNSNQVTNTIGDRMFYPFLAIPDELYWPLMDWLFYIGDISWETREMLGIIRLHRQDFSFVKDTQSDLHSSNSLSGSEEPDRNPYRDKQLWFDGKPIKEADLFEIASLYPNQKLQKAEIIQSIIENGIKVLNMNAPDIDYIDAQNSKNSQGEFTRNSQSESSRKNSQSEFTRTEFDNVPLSNLSRKRIYLASTMDELMWLVGPMDRFLLGYMDTVKEIFDTKKSWDWDGNGELDGKGILSIAKKDLYLLPFCILPPISMQFVFENILTTLENKEDPYAVHDVSSRDIETIKEARLAFLNNDIQRSKNMIVANTDTRIYSGTARDLFSLETLLSNRKNWFGVTKLNIGPLKPYQCLKNHPFYILQDPFFYATVFWTIASLIIIITNIVKLVREKEKQE